MEPIINSQLPEFKVQAFQNGNFKTVFQRGRLVQVGYLFLLPGRFYLFVNRVGRYG